ncbi:MAG: Lrp/AsnC ligand binding domain-containing protein [Methanomassiliicoccales archaeon]|jgi:DNA-binding Lrp family transcriptional regulator|nr:Lrp/AsnC ligand binding domain-containing protein [Methanomassiliicoccales archaeon]
MPTAIVLINTEIGKEGEVIDSLSKLSEVKEIYLVYGVYDIVAKLDSETMESLEGLITQKIRHVGAIRSTLTLIVSRRGK